MILADYRDKDGSNARKILDRAEQSKGANSKGGSKGAKGAPGAGSRKEPESNDRRKQKDGEGGEKDERRQIGEGEQKDEGEHDDDEGVDKGECGQRNKLKPKLICLSPSICSVDQSAITGESLAVDKFHGEIVYYTTICKRGKCFARMTTTAKKSFVGKTASLVTGSKDQGHFQKVSSPSPSSLCAAYPQPRLLGDDYDWYGPTCTSRRLLVCGVDWWLLPWYQDRNAKGQ
jgi:H+-transporting ATPase